MSKLRHRIIRQDLHEHCQAVTPVFARPLARLTDIAALNGLDDRVMFPR
jgi:hypothetical protein